MDVCQAVGALRQGNLPQTFPLWQLRLVVDMWDGSMMRGAADRHDILLTSKFLPIMKNSVDVILDDWLRENSSVVKSYIRGEALSRDARSATLASFLVYRSIPSLKDTHTQMEGCSSFGDFLSRTSDLGIPVRDLLRLAPVLVDSASGSLPGLLVQAP